MLGFSKEVLLAKISTLNDFNTLNYLGMNVYLIGFIIAMIFPFLIGMIIRACTKKPNFWIAFIITWTIEVVILLLMLTGIIPQLTAIN